LRRHDLFLKAVANLSDVACLQGPLNLTLS
jgi:hypothetical protein